LGFEHIPLEGKGGPVVRKMAVAVWVFAVFVGASALPLCGSAQTPTTPPPASPSAPPTAPNAAMPSPTVPMPTNSPATISPATQWLASNVYNQSVYDKNEQKIGDLTDLIIEKDGHIKSAVIGVGGFLGVGQKDVEIPFADLKMMTRNGKNWLALDRTKDQLQSAPTFDKSSLKLP
jgi:sporulation protein YlmC with PRC-barrel domain